MAEHTFDYSHTEWNTRFHSCRKCGKVLSDWAMEVSDPDCPVDEFKQGDYSEGFSFEGMTDDAIKRILGSGNVPNADCSR